MYPLNLNLLSFSTLLLEVPTVRLFEKAICNRYYRDNDHLPGQFVPSDVLESRCKVAHVQDVLANVVGWQLSFNAMAGLLTAVYYGRAAEERGRKPILCLSAVGITLMLLLVVLICTFDDTFDVHLAWLMALCLLIGGGPRVFNSMVFTMVSDQVSDGRRTKYLFLLHAGPHVNRLVTPLLAATLMNIGIYWPFITSFFLLAVTLVVIIFIDEKTVLVKDNQSDMGYEGVAGEEHMAFTPDDDEYLHEPGPPPNTGLRPSSFTTSPSTQLLGRLSHDAPVLTSFTWWHDTMSQIFELFSTPTARFCLVAFLVKRIAFTSEGFVFQYASEKFRWKLADTIWFRVSAAAGAMLTMMVICPLLTNFARSRNYSTHLLDIWIVRTCLVILFVSFFTAFEAKSAAWLLVPMFGMGLGEGIEPALQGIVTWINDPAHYAQLFTTLAVVDTIAELIGGPLTATLMSIGRSATTPSAGYCSLASAVMFLSMAILSGCIPRSSRRD